VQRRGVTPTGDVDLLTAPRFRDELMTAAREDGSANLVVDMAGVTFLDSTGIGVLIAVNNLLKGDGRRLVLRSPSRNVRRVLEICAIDQVIAIEDDRRASPVNPSPHRVHGRSDPPAGV
jgi:stage II sporulation protein AA (anti-sigma F factor antagonist)